MAGGIVLYLGLLTLLFTVGYVIPTRDLPISTNFSSGGQFDHLLGELETNSKE